jgi:hypothetical protein
MCRRVYGQVEQRVQVPQRGGHLGSLVDAPLTGAPRDALAGRVPFRVRSTGTDAELESAAGLHLQRG